jgi:hypothetical protein
MFRAISHLDRWSWAALAVFGAYLLLIVLP